MPHLVSYKRFRKTQYITSIGLFYKKWKVCGGVSDCEELVGEVNHTTESVTDLFSFVDVVLSIL